MNELDYLRKTVSERTPGPWLGDNDLYVRLLDGSVVADLSARLKEGTCGYDNKFIALLGTCADEIVKVIEAAEIITKAKFEGWVVGDRSWFDLDEALATLKAKIKSVMEGT